MAVQTLDALPIEVLQALCEELGASHSPSVAQLALVNRQCRRAAACVLFRRITLDIESPEKLAVDIQQWTSTLGTNDSFRHVRALVIRGNIWQEWRRNAHKQTPDSAGKRLPPFVYEDSWLPLAAFIEKLAGLKDIESGCESGFPSCLLSALHSDKLSACRLHIGHFRLSGLIREPTGATSEPLELKPNELALVTSPNLYAVKLTGSDITSTGKADWHSEAIWDLLASGKSSICEVEYSYRRPKDTPALRRARGRGSYPGLLLPDTSERDLRVKAKLHSLVLSARSEIVKQWWQHADFSALQVLKIKNGVDHSTLEWAAEHASFPSLSTLEIHSEPGNNESAISDLLQSLPSLKELAVRGGVHDLTFSAILDHHGLSLRRLSIPGFASSIESLRMLNAACPFLEHLEVRTSRTQGDDEEVQLYTSLGIFSRVRTLCLNMDCSIAGSDSDDPSWRRISQDSSCKEGYTRRLLINCAIDAALVDAIFHQIASARFNSSSRLQNLEINVVRAGTICFGEAEISAGQQSAPYPGIDTAKSDGVYRHFERQWKCTPNPRDDKPGETITEEVQISQAKRKRFDDARGGKPPELGDLEPEFSALWARESSQDWRHAWSSLPLAEM
ncbi:putative leucine-rich repeat domain superfamily [Septoria linicola]|nr:putative leucine-rich repeat domain superfamily [Septoria linicola]